MDGSAENTFIECTKTFLSGPKTAKLKLGRLQIYLLSNFIFKPKGFARNREGDLSKFIEDRECSFLTKL